MSKKNKTQIVIFVLTLLVSVLNIAYAHNTAEREKELGEAYNTIETSVNEMRTTERLVTEQIAYLDHIYATAEEYDVPPEVVLAVMKVESNFDPSAENGRCYGTMQIHDIHCKGFEIKTEELLDLHKNTEVGTTLLSGLMENSNNLTEALGKYNMGQAGYEKWCKETGGYVTEYAEKVQDILNKWKEK